MLKNRLQEDKPRRRTERDEEVSKLRQSEESQELSKEDRWMIWPKPPTLWDLYKGMTKQHVREVRERKYLCKRCNAEQNVTYRYAHFKRIRKGEKEFESKHLAAWCVRCGYRVRFVRDTPARWVIMQETHKARIDEIRAKSGRTDNKKPRRKGRKR